MPDEHDYDDDQDSGQESSVMRDLRKKAKRADTLEAEVASLRQETAILKAGITLTPAQQKALLAVHDGDLEPDAIRKTAADLGFVTEKAEEPAIPVEEQQAHQAMAEATAGAMPSEAQTKTFEEQMREAATSPEALQAFLEKHDMIEFD